MARPLQKLDAAESDELTVPLFLEGVKAGAPVALGILTYGIAYGVLCRQSGLTLFSSTMMSIFVYAGTAQLIAVGMLQAGQSLEAIVATTFLVNVRYLLLGAAMAPYLATWKAMERFLFGFFLSDESFAVVSAKFSAGRQFKALAFGVNAVAILGWVGSSILGYVASDWVPDMRAFGLDFALPAVFIGLLAILIQNRMTFVISMLGGGLAVAGYLVGLGGFEVLVATIIAATFGVGLERWIQKTSS